MKNYASSGYLVPVAEMTKLLPTINQKEFTALIAENDAYVLGEYLSENLPEHFPTPETVFVMSGDAEFDDENLHAGETYALFDESSLYEKKPTLGMTYLAMNGVKPVERRWVDFA